MKRVASHKGYGIFDSGMGYLLISSDDEWDFVQEPFCCAASARQRIDELTTIKERKNV